MTLKDFNALVEKQGNKCAICKRPLRPGKKYTDHDHLTGKARGILCPGCNTRVGMVEVNPELIFRILSYIQKGVVK